ncbi:MAG: hypothetical protein V1802_01155 [Candidatus Aenigmatarchaeota archaeon]
MTNQREISDENTTAILEKFKSIRYRMVGTIEYRDDEISSILDILPATNVKEAVRSVQLYWESRAEMGEMLGVKRWDYSLFDPNDKLVQHYDSSGKWPPDF